MTPSSAAPPRTLPTSRCPSTPPPPARRRRRLEPVSQAVHLSALKQCTPHPVSQARCRPGLRRTPCLSTNLWILPETLLLWRQTGKRRSGRKTFSHAGGMAQVLLTTAPDATGATHWGQQMFFLDPSISCAPSDTISARPPTPPPPGVSRLVTAAALHPMRARAVRTALCAVPKPGPGCLPGPERRRRGAHSHWLPAKATRNLGSGQIS